MGLHEYVRGAQRMERKGRMIGVGGRGRSCKGAGREERSGCQQEASCPREEV